MPWKADVDPQGSYQRMHPKKNVVPTNGTVSDGCERYLLIEEMGLEIYP